MKLSHTLGGCDNMLHGREFPMNSVILELDNGTELVCRDFQHPRKKPLELFCYIPAEKKWVKTIAKNKYTEMMWDYYKAHKLAPKHVKVNLPNPMWDQKKLKDKNGKPKKLPHNVWWAMKHPYQGGKVSPR